MRHVLIVDDEPAIREVLRMALESGGAYRASTAGNADEADAIMRLDRPDAAIVDVVMRGCSGLALAHRAVGDGIPVLIVTGDPESQTRLATAGCPFLAKPFRLETLYAEMRGLLGSAGDQLARLSDLRQRLGVLRCEVQEVLAVSRETLARSHAGRLRRVKEAAADKD